MNEKTYKSLHDFIEVDSAVDAFLTSLDQSSILSISDIDANILWVNHNFENAFKCDQEYAIGKNYKIFSSKTHPIEFYRGLWTTLKAGRNWRGIFCNVDLRGNPIWLQTHIIPIKDADEKLKYFITVRQDVTYLMDKKNSLESKIKDELKNKNDFFSRLSHEIKTPLNAILGMVDILEMSELNTEQKDCIDTIYNSSQRLLQTINKTIEFNRVESEDFKLSETNFNLDKVVNQLREQYTAIANQKNLSFKIENKATNKVFSGDIKRIYQVISYIIENALKFTAEGSVKITIKENVELNQISFEVRDTGVGFKEEVSQTVFSKILQSADYNGFGLSLAIAKKISDHMHADIGYKTSEGAGSFFWFKVPVKVVDENVISIEKIEANIVDSDLRVLIVEDDQINQRLLKKLLNKLEIYPETANNGLEALALLKEQGFNVVFMDVNMPVMDGLTATKKIRLNPEIYGSPIIIAVTANSVTGDEDHCTRVGMDDYISKPIKREALEKIVFGLQGKRKYISNFKPKSNLKYFIQKLNEDFIGDEEILVSFARNVIDKAPLKFARIEKLISENNFKLIHIEANSFKDLISCLHHEELRRLIEMIETYGKDGKVKNITPLLNDIREQVYSLCMELEDYFFKEVA